MACLPLIERELRVALRKQRPARSRLKVGALSAGCAVLFLLLGALTGSPGLGQTLERCLCLAGLYCILCVPQLTSGVLADERRNRTLGLLFLSGLGAGEVFLSKLLSSGLIAFTNLLAIFPLLALPFLMGGVSFELFLGVSCALPVLMLFALAISLLASALTREQGTALSLAVALKILLCAVTPGIFLAQSHFASGTTPSLWWLRLSPAYGPYLVWAGFRTGFHGPEQAEFWSTMAVTLAWSALALTAAVLILKRCWREEEAEAPAGSWREQWHKVIHGTQAYRRSLAHAWLDVNPFVWLNARDREPASLGWALIGGMGALWLLCWMAWPSQWPSVANCFVTATLLNSVLAWLTRHTAAEKLGLSRRDGAYEVLLTTPLNPSDIVWGTLESLHWHFRGLSNFLLAINTLLMAGGSLTRGWNVNALMVYFLIWLLLLAWTWRLGHDWGRVLPVMWASLNCARPAYAVWRTSGFNTWSWFWILYNLQHLGRGFRKFPTGSLGELVLVGFVAIIMLLVWLSHRASLNRADTRDRKWDPHRSSWTSTKSAQAAKVCEQRLVAEFREIVREPLPDPSDPRFKKWNVLERFPWGWELVQQQLHERLARR